MSHPPPPIKSDEFWFEDGDIVLSVTEDDVTHHFRVHRTILAIASPIFHDMLLLPQPLDSGRPPVTLPGDSVQDMNALLGALYYTRKSQRLTLDAALGILRLSHKYQIEGLQQEMVQRLQQDWPLNHSDYHMRLTAFGSQRHSITQVAKAIETMQRCQVKEPLPTAFYELDCAWGSQWLQIIGALSPENLLRLSVGRERSTLRLREFINRAGKLEMWKASRSTSIYERRNAFNNCNADYPQILVTRGTRFCLSGFSNLRRKLSDMLFEGTAVIPALSKCGRDDLGDAVCGGCKNWYMDLLKNKIQELWENIPEDFDLPAVDPELYSQSTFSL